jgi:hypothetical protein
MPWFSLIVLFLGIVYHMGLGMITYIESKTPVITNPDIWLHFGFAVAQFIALCYTLTLLD